ncbi:MAG: CHAT domain-containing protein [Deltaproteobacteria bacterium]|jgi:CHAT domain-containing protein/tetratricopeptide (TPR) repeat protein|nr:CHAT domain-containing protein [Deltaproteobacteria bacterium]MBT4643067.1 CHAT domain-containing protein [Deltaproteobacteria bacterium]MBT6501744.1 CHAT domain-containing protein [Deltaproteobacteria bacterium]MBT7154139.1 CHAT domain-containing protein [Deltaproteobacteria bacterium]MBT7711123.1 CHAT domain-containing protein [Deltaproteobacteria bacterium]
MLNRLFKFKTSTISIWISIFFLTAMMLPLTLAGEPLSPTQLEGIQTQLQSKKDPVTRTKLFVLLINNAIQYQTEREEIKYRQELHRSLKGEKTLRIEYSVNLYQLATIYYQKGSLQKAWDHFEILLKNLPRTETKLRNLTLQHLSMISSKLNKTKLEEKYLALYVVSLGKVSSFYETSGGFEKLLQLALKTGSAKEDYYFENWYQSAVQNGEIKDQKRILTQWINYVTQTKSSFSPEPLDLLLELLTAQNALAEIQDLRRLYAQNTPDEAKKVELFEEIHRHNQVLKKPTELGILTRLYQSYRNSKKQEDEQKILEILAQRSDYDKRDEALKQLAILSQKNENWILALNTYQKLAALNPLDKNKEGVLILDNLISISQKLSRDDLALQYLRQKALTESSFIQDAARHQSFTLALEIYRQKQNYDEAIQLYHEMEKAPFQARPYPRMYEIHFQGAVSIEEKGDPENTIKTYQLSLNTLLSMERPDLNQAIRIAQRVLLLTESHYPGEREVAVLKQINEIHKKRNNPADQAKTELIIAQKLEKSKDKKAAVVFYNQALASYRKVDNQKMVSQLLTLLANLEEGTSGKKLNRLQELESTQEKSSDTKQLIVTRIEIGNYYKSQGDQKNAVTYYLKAGNNDNGGNDILSAQAFYYAGLLLAQTGDIRQSSEVYQKALHKKSATNEKEAIFAQTHQAYAKNLDQQQEPSKALEQIDIALQYNLKELKGSLIEIKATILINSNQYKAAESTLEGYLSSLTNGQDTLPLMILLVKAQLGSQNPDGAMVTLNRALKGQDTDQLTAQQYDILSLKSYTLSLKKDMVAAIRNQEKLVTLLEQSNIKEKLGSANLDLSKYYLEIGRIPEALKANKQADGWIKEGTVDHLKMLLNFAKINQKQGKNDASLDYFNQLQKNITSESPPEIAAEMFYQRGFANLSASRFEDALSDFKQAETSYIKLNQKSEALQSKMAQANVLMSLGKIGNSERIYLSLLSETGDNQGAKGDVNNALAFLYSELGQYKKALQNSEDGEQAYKKAARLNRIPEVLNARGLIFLKMNDFDQAEVTFLKATKQNEQYQNPLLDSEITNNLGGLYKQRGNLERAREQLMKTAELQKKLGFESLLALTYNNIASVYLDENKYDEALSFLKQSRTFAERFQLKKEIASSWNNEGILFFKQEKYEEAQKAFLEALKPQKELELKIDLARTHNNLSIIAAKQSDFKKALDLAQIAVGSLSLKPLDNSLFFPNPEQESVLAPDLMKDSLQIKGAYLREIANSSQDSATKVKYLNVSYQSFALAIEIIESLRAQIKGEESQKKLLQANIDIFQQLIAILYELGTRAPKQGFHEKAYYYAEMSRARSFLDQLQEQVARSSLNLPQEVRDKENELKTKIATLDGLIFVELKKPQKERDEKKIEDWQIKKTTTLLEHRNFTKELEEKFPAYASLKYPKVYGVKETQTELLHEKSMLLTYFVGADQSYGWAVAKNGVSMVALPPNADIDQLIRKYRKTLVNPLIVEDEEDDEMMIDSTQSHIAIGLQIYRKILDPMLKNAGPQVNQLVLVPDGVLYYLPFETILTQIHPQTDERFPKGREYLLHQYSIHYSPSVSVLGMIQTQVKNRNPELMAKRKDFLGFGDPEYKPTAAKAAAFSYNKTLKQQGFYELDRLFNTRAELGEISAIFPESNVTYLREKAKESAVKLNIKGYKYIHFATHGILDERNPEFSGVVMNLIQPDKPEDGFLQSSEIFDLKLDSDLVVLSACETGLGKVIKGEGMVGLTRAFIFAGTPSIVVSLWTVADESTSKLMIYFYKYLNEGHPKDEALRKARLELMNEAEDEELLYSDPFYWGPFILNGTRI